MTTLLVHEWISESGGAEKVLDGMVEAFPDCEIRALWNDAPTRYDVRVTETWLARTPIRRRKSMAVPFALAAWTRQLVGFEAERVVISSHLFAHHARFPEFPDAPRYAYVHTPARYIWTPELDSRGNGLLAKATSPFFRVVDRRRAQRVTAVAANSHFVKERIAKSWNMDSSVIYPPVDVIEILQVNDWRNALSSQDEAIFAALPSEFILGASRLVEYKRFDDVFRFAASVGLPAVVGGDGPELAKLKSQAAELGARTYFLGRISTPLLRALYQRAIAYVFPPVEDFGIMPVEAMAAGARVIVNSVGGASESVQHGISGVHTQGFGGDDARKALELAQAVSAEAAISRARYFAKERFIDELHSWVGLTGGLRSR